MKSVLTITVLKINDFLNFSSLSHAHLAFGRFFLSNLYKTITAEQQTNCHKPKQPCSAERILQSPYSRDTGPGELSGVHGLLGLANKVLCVYGSLGSHTIKSTMNKYITIA